MNISVKIFSKIDSAINYVSNRYDKLQAKMADICGSVTVPPRDSIYYTKGFLYPDYDKVIVDVSKKGWQKKLNFNKKNINPNASEFMYEKYPETQYLISKPQTEEFKNLYFRTHKSSAMKVVESPNTGIMIDNFSAPSGTISIEGTLDDTFYTNKLFQCVALSIVDKAKNKQKLMHFFPYSDENDSIRLLRFLCRGMENPEITLVPGARAETNNSIEFLTTEIRSLYPDLKINHKHVPESFTIDDALIGLHNGELFCVKYNLELLDSINPKNKIIHI